jgi:hypothetical protein
MKKLKIINYKFDKNFYFLLIFLLFINPFDAIKATEDIDIDINKNSRNKNFEEIFQEFDFTNINNNNNEKISKSKIKF